MSDDMSFAVPSGTRQFWCSAFDGDECIHGMSIFSTSAEEAVQTMAREVIEGTDGEWANGRIEVRDQTDEEGLARTFAVSCELTELGDGEVEAEVTIDEVGE